MELKTTELRIGNYVKLNTNHSDSEIIEINSKDFGYIENQQGIFEPIPLTEEWLVNFGLNEYNDIKVKDNGFICIERTKSEINFYIMGHDNPTYASMHSIKLNHVHQLQNLYFALTGKELTHQKIN